MARRKSRPSKRPRLASNPDEIVDVLCQCGWGRLRCPRSEVPADCPLCGLQLGTREEWIDEDQDQASVEFNTGRACGWCRSTPCQRTRGCVDLAKRIAGSQLPRLTAADEARLRGHPAPMQTFGPDVEGMILDEQEERYQENPRSRNCGSRRMNPFVIRRLPDGAYVAGPGSDQSYTRRLEDARTFVSREVAQSEACGNEQVVSTEDLLRRATQRNSRFGRR